MRLAIYNKLMLFKRLGIDLGTANSLVYLQGKGVVLNEPSVVAVSLDDRRVVAVGNSAKEMLGRTPGDITASRPMREGVIADYVVTEAMLRYFIKRVCGRSFFFKPEVMICIPAGCTQVEKRAVEDATLSAGARNVYVISEPLAAAIGVGIPIEEPSGNMIVDIGGGAAEATVISLSGVVVSRSLRVAGNKLDDAITSYIRKKEGLLIGETTAEELKILLGSAIKVKENKKMIVKGRDTISGLPRQLEVSTNDVAEALRSPLSALTGLVKSVLEEVPPELASDIIDRGIVLTGGTALLRNLDKLLTEETGVACHVAEEPMLAVIKGIGMVLENMEAYQRSFSRR